MTGEIIATQGRSHVREAIQEFADGNLRAKLLEVLCCEGCIMGAGMTADLPLFVRRQRVSEFVCQRMKSIDEPTWQKRSRSQPHRYRWTAHSVPRTSEFRNRTKKS